jgi:hypothetical protein
MYMLIQFLLYLNNFSKIGVILNFFTIEMLGAKCRSKFRSYFLVKYYSKQYNVRIT